MFETLILMLDATIRTAPPLILAAMAGMFCERSGVVNIALEGKLLASAFASAAAAAVTGSAWIGLGVGVGISILFALLHGFATITHRGDQVVSGMAINILAAGLTVTLGRYWFDQGGQTPALSGAARFAPIDLPYAKELYDVPVIGQLYSELLSGHSLLEYVAFAAVPLAWWVLFRTRFGLRLRAVGEAPAAVDTAGISVVRMRYTALIIGGLLAGIGGTYLAVAQTAQFIPNMSAGKGFMALAALVFGKWRPWNAMAACLLFGFLDAVAIRLQGVSIGDFPIPVQAIEALPYILTVFLLAGFIGKRFEGRLGEVDTAACAEFATAWAEGRVALESLQVHRRLGEGHVPAPRAAASGGRREQALELALAGMALATLVVSWLKRNSIHHCPWDISEYGGFAPILPLFAGLPDGIAPGRCFPGGHASVGFGMLSYAFAAHAGGSRHTFWITTGVLATGVFASTVQMLRGAHFLSHQLWTLWWCWAVCLAVYGLFRWRSWI